MQKSTWVMLALGVLVVPSFAWAQDSAIAGVVSGYYYPPARGSDWETIDPRDAGWDRDRLEELLSFLEERGSTGFVILYRGRLMVERYWRGASRDSTGDVGSVQKSLTALLVGIAQEQGLLRIDDPVTKHLGAGWSNSPKTEPSITLRHLLTMTTGLSDALTYEAEPGTVWFRNNAYHFLKAVLEKASGQDINSYTKAKVWGPIGDQASAWVERKNRWRYLVKGTGDQGSDWVIVGPFTGWSASLRDMARFGLLVLSGGRWNDEPVISDSAYLRQALTPAQELNKAYGFLWWLNGGDSYNMPGRGESAKYQRWNPKPQHWEWTYDRPRRGRSGKGPLLPAAPRDLVFATGHGGNKISVVPSLDLVVAARHGQMSLDEALSLENEIWQRLMAAAPKR